MELVRTDGQVALHWQATMPAGYRYTHSTPAPPAISLSNKRVYFADADVIKFMQYDGSSGTVGPYPGGSNTVAGFAVSPDDRRIAVAQLTFQSPDSTQASLRLYVEDLGGGNRVELFTSTTVAEWPVAWTAGHLVIAVGPAVLGNASTNPYNAFLGYHVADAATGKRLVTMSNDCLSGPLVPGGSACESGGSIAAQDFDGIGRVFSPSGGAGPNLALSPNGSSIAGTVGASIVTFGYHQGDARYLNSTGIAMGWIDDLHLVFYRPNGFSRGILNLGGGSVPPVIPIPACTCGNAGIFFGALTPAI